MSAHQVSFLLYERTVMNLHILYCVCLIVDVCVDIFSVFAIRIHVMEVFCAMKTNLTSGQLALAGGCMYTPRHSMRRIKRSVRYLAKAMTDVAETAEQRFLPSNHLPHVFHRKVTGSVDSFPIKILRPKLSRLRKICYNGKAKIFSLKVGDDVD